MKSFEELWKEAKEIDSDLKDLAEDYYEKYKDTLTEDCLRILINILAAIDNWHTYLNDEKIDHVDLGKVKKMFKEHSHLLDKVVLPVE